MSRYSVGGALSGARILILEPDDVIASDLTYTISRSGGQVAGPCRNSADAMIELDTDTIDAVVIGRFPAGFKDLNFAHRLEENFIPFVFHVDVATTAWSTIFPDVAVLQKGCSHTRLIAQLARLVEEQPPVPYFLNSELEVISGHVARQDIAQHHHQTQLQ